MSTQGPALAEVETASAEATRAAGAALAARCRPGDVVLLVGDLGAGKTTFAQGMARGLGVAERVVSPTFTLVRHYKTASTALPQFLHADVYRLEDLADIEDLGLHELVEDGALVAVEWGERAAAVLPPGALVVELAPEDGPGGERRRITVSAPAGAWEGRAEGLAADLAAAVAGG